MPRLLHYQTFLDIDGKVISSGEMVYEGTSPLPININSCSCVSFNHEKIICFSVYIQVLLKGIWIRGKSDNVATVAWIIVRININRINFRYY